MELDPNETVHDFDRIWVRPDRISLKPLGWGFPGQIPPWQSWAEIKKARLAGGKLVLMINPSCDHEGTVLRSIIKVNQTFHVD